MLNGEYCKLEKLFIEIAVDNQRQFSANMDLPLKALSLYLSCTLNVFAIRDGVKNPVITNVSLALAG